MEPNAEAPASYPIPAEEAEKLATLLANADSSNTLSAALEILRSVPGVILTALENGMVRVERTGGHNFMLLYPTATLNAFLAEELVAFLIPAELKAYAAGPYRDAVLSDLLQGTVLINA
jgi:hypothetical protein